MERLALALALLALVSLALVVARRFVGAQRRAGLRAAHEDATPETGDRVLFFSTTTCVQCREQQAPELERLRATWRRPLVIEHVDAIEREDLARRYRILTVPSTVVFAGGEPRAVNYGYASAETIAEQLAPVRLRDASARA
ncbi:MAG TPA: thioredoxin family protein [Dehalococcoidia bacterium]|nr:thioredoxin family protein [Dehalococcoidia bacterium]